MWPSSITAPVSERPCAGKLDLYFPPADADEAERAAALGKARRLCRGCPWREPCLILGLREYATLAREELLGQSVWGGAVLPDELAAARRLAARSRRSA